jgi:hypothetical protein
MVCEVCRTGPEGVIEQGALWASEGTKYESTKVGSAFAHWGYGVTGRFEGALWASEDAGLRALHSYFELNY